MMRDEKLVGAAVRSKQPVERVIWVWGAILESASEIDDGGRYSFDAAEAAYFLRTDDADILAVTDALIAARRISDNVVVKWGDRQFQSDKSKERQAAYRERRKDKKVGNDSKNEERDVTVTVSDGQVTAQDTDTDTEVRKNMSETSSDVINFPKPRRKRNDYPEDFEKFYLAYPSDPGMSKPEALKQWGKLSEENRGHAVDAIPAFIGWISDQGKDYRVVHACRYLSQRRFDGFIESQSMIKDSAPVGVLVKRGTPAWESWQRIKSTPCSEQLGGWHFPTEYPPTDLKVAT
jgi:hypothetical protein